MIALSVQELLPIKPFALMILTRKAISKITSENTKNKKMASVNRFFICVMCVGLLLLTSCSRCEECEAVNGGTETICETEFDNSSQYEDAIADREADGATCTATGGF